MPPAVSSRVVTVPNALSCLRLLLIPVFLVLLVTEQYLWALVTLVVSSVTDFVDGYIARHFNQISRVGQLLDPAADRLFIFSTLVGLAIRGFLPWWLVGVIVARDVLLLVLGVILAQHRFGPLPVHHLGKMGTFLLLVAMPVLVLGAAFPALDTWAAPVGWAAALWGVFLYWWAGIVYAVQTGRIIRIGEDDGDGASARVER
ncbi:CDP-alcohol phosphatidyltransferase family protein [Pseudolysinimonas sp.]|uniref:CDP-alcohol phosphatidyltransferase family protein n=1 Tax=Pseudolysinimonas sp. TaxID=2680009 RepID=UPI003F7EB803